MNPFIGRALAALGAVLGIVAIWVSVTSRGGKYWDGANHAIGISMLVLAILVGIGLVLATWLRQGALDQVWLLPALVLGGLFLFFPIGAWGGGETGQLGVGAWLGVAACGCFVLAGILNAIPEPSPAAAAATAGASPAGVFAQRPETEPVLAQPPAGTAPPAGWYPDPKGEARLRYWDGKDWTVDTAA
jgi:uncharacterized protein DUF2510